jgi:hypothetical protein
MQATEFLEWIDGRSIVPEEETFDSVQVVLNPTVQAVLPNTIINPDKKVCFLLVLFFEPPLMFLSSDHFSFKLAKRFSKFKSKIAHSFYKDKDLDDNFTGPSS